MWKATLWLPVLGHLIILCGRGVQRAWRLPYLEGHEFEVLAAIQLEGGWSGALVVGLQAEDGVHVGDILVEDEVQIH